MIAEITLEPGGVIAWLFVGLIAGWLTGKIMQGRGYGIVRDTILGLIGAFLGGYLFSFVYQGTWGFLGSVGVAVVGAIILVALVRAVTHRSHI
jgi:uncharacterized membrane protein YeaQ/YmgE (transglycosylase-associated protein family)